MMTALKLLLWLFVIAANIIADKDGRKPNYVLMFILRGAAWLFHMALWVPGTWMGTDFANGIWLKIVLWPTIFDITSYWLFFELGLNILRKNPLLYYDHKEKDSGWIDKFFAWAGPLAHLAAKLICLGLLIFSIWKMYQIS